MTIPFHFHHIAAYYRHQLDTRARSPQMQAQWGRYMLLASEAPL
jgi:hypothetical protein